MNNKLNVVSLFDGCSNGQIAFSKLTDNYNWFASEIDIDAINITNHNFPNTINIGNVKNVNLNSLPNKINLLIGGSPCTNFSINGDKKGMSTSDNVPITSLNQYLELKKNNTKLHGQSYLFWEYVRFLKFTNPDYFILENVMMNKKWINIISNELNVEPIIINSNKFVPQNRNRLYWTNINVNPLHNFKYPLLNELIPNATGGFGYRGIFNKKENKYVRTGTTRKDNLANCITTNINCQFVTLDDNSIRRLTIQELLTLQGVPTNYFDVPNVFNTKKRTIIGNSFTVDVIHFILSHIFNNENYVSPHQKNYQLNRMDF